MFGPRTLFWSMMVLTLAALAGCGRAPEYTGPQRFAVSGSVTFKGEPVTGGTISLVPEDGKSNPAGGPIEGGKYSIPDVKGPNSGAYRVQIYWYKPTGKKIKDPDTGEQIDEVKQVVPPQFNDATTLTTTISGPATDLNFDVN